MGKFKNFLNEGSLENTIKKIAKLTDENDHNEARIVGAKLIKDKTLQKAYEDIATKHKRLGHMPSDLGDARYKLDKKFHGAY